MVLPQLQLILALWGCFRHFSAGLWLVFSFLELAVSGLGPSAHLGSIPLLAPTSLTLRLKPWLLAHLLAPLVVTAAMNTAQSWQTVLLT